MAVYCELVPLSIRRLFVRPEPEGWERPEPDPPIRRRRMGPRPDSTPEAAGVMASIAETMERLQGLVLEAERQEVEVVFEFHVREDGYRFPLIELWARCHDHAAARIEESPEAVRARVQAVVDRANAQARREAE